MNNPILIDFVTGNADKLQEVKNILGSLNANVEVYPNNTVVNEIQGPPIDIAMQKCRDAAAAINGPVIVEDTSLAFHALNGFPGPYIKHAYEALGLDGLNYILGLYEDKSATAQCIFCYSEGPGKEPEIFTGLTLGKIVLPRGSRDFGWDAIFEPIGYTQTFAEMDQALKNRISPRHAALVSLSSYLKDKYAKSE